MLKKCWDHFEETILVYSYLLVVPLLFVQVVSRYVFNHSLSWSEELARYIFIWQVWLGSSYCVKENRHIRIDIFTEHLSPQVRKIYEIVITMISIAFCCFLIYLCRLRSRFLCVPILNFRLCTQGLDDRFPLRFIYGIQLLCQQGTPVRIRRRFLFLCAIVGFCYLCPY